ncbi:MAG: hypothetical protein ACTS6A_01265 [Candidatus Hodgkinia cicadicola]
MRQFARTDESGVGEEEGASAVEVVLAKVWNRERVVRPRSFGRLLPSLSVSKINRRRLEAPFTC